MSNGKEPANLKECCQRPELLLRLIAEAGLCGVCNLTFLRKDHGANRDVGGRNGDHNQNENLVSGSGN